MAGKVFINYRKAANLAEAKLLRHVLQRRRHFGENGVFLDESGLEGGDHWPETLAKQVDDSIAMVALICKGWADIRNPEDQRRLENPNDFVRFEIARALARNIPLIPVLIDGATMPGHDELPLEIANLSFKQTMLFRKESSDDDGDRIAERLKELLARRRREVRAWQRIAAGAAGAALVAGIAAGWRLAPRVPDAPDVAALRQRAATAEKAQRRLSGELADVTKRAKAAESAHKEAEARLAAAEKETERLNSLLKKGGATAQRIASLGAELDEQKKRADEALAEVKARKEENADLQRQIDNLSKKLAAKPPVNDVKDTGTTQQPGKVAVMVRTASWRDEEQWFKPGNGETESFRDCINRACTEQGPEMVVVPAGSFLMGSPENEKQRDGDEGPQHRVKIGQPFAVGKFEVTFADWNACVKDGGCRHEPESAWGRGDQPVIYVSWENITNEYLPWLRKKTGKDYRLLNEAEWEYVARADTETPFWWGTSITTKQANYNGDYTYGVGSKGEYRGQTVAVKSFEPNPWGLYQVHGNVWEWVEDCWNHNYNNAPTDGSAWTTGDCSRRVLRGGSWYFDPRGLRAAFRGWYRPDDRQDVVGFRVSRTL